MRILVFESDQKFINTLPYGFVRDGHEVLVTGTLDRTKLDFLLKEFVPDFTLTLGWSSTHSEEQLLLLEEYIEKFKAPHVFWATEDPTFYDEFSLPLVKQLKPAHIFTVSQAKVEAYKKEGFSASHLEFGYSTLLRVEKSIKPTYDIALVANAYSNVLYWYPDHYRTISMSILLTPLLKHNLPIHLFGDGWEEMETLLHHKTADEYLHKSVPYLSISSIFNQSKINLCLQNYDDDVITMRTFEIMGSYGLALSSAHKRIQEYFQNGSQLLIAKTPQETLELCRYYLKKDHLCHAIRERATKVIHRNHTYGHRAKEALKVLRGEIL